MVVKVEVKMDYTFVYNIVAKCIVPFDESPLDFLNLFYSPFNSPIIINYRYALFLIVTINGQALQRCLR